MVPGCPARSALATQYRPLCHLGVGDHAATDPRGRRRGPVSGIPGAISDAGRPGAGNRRGSFGVVERTGLLPPRPHAAQGGAIRCQPPSWQPARPFTRTANPAGHRLLHRGGHRQHRPWGGGRRRGRQCRARIVPARGVGGCGQDERRQAEAQGRGPGGKAGRSGASGRLQPGHDGAGRQGVPAAQPAMPDRDPA